MLPVNDVLRNRHETYVFAAIVKTVKRNVVHKLICWSA